MNKDMGNAKLEKKTLEIPDGINRIGEVANHVKELLSDLEKRLGCVMQAMPPSVEGKDGGPVSMTEVGRLLFSIEKTLNSAKDTAIGILDRLEV